MVVFSLSRALVSAIYTLAAIAVIANASDNPFTYNGGSIMAMAGNECVALAVDKRFASGPQMVNVSPRRILVVHSRLILGFAGLNGDIQGIAEELSIHVASKRSKEGSRLAMRNGPGSSAVRPISPRSMAALTSHVLYSKRSSPFYCEVLIAGLHSLASIDVKEGNGKRETHNGKKSGKRKFGSFLCATDMLGARMESCDFACSGAASKSMYGTAEGMWKPNMDSDKLLRVCGKAFLSALERDCLSGYGAVIYLITPSGITEHELVCRND